MKLLIVESPTKAKTLSKYLKGFKVVASMGHIIDLPSKRLGVDIENNFKPKYEIIPGKEKVIAMLKKEAADAKEIYIGSDPDREGEAIAFHIASLFDGKEVRRVLFHEITKTGVLKAIEEFSKLNDNLYNSQQARRILDRIVGYKLSPFLWRSVKKGLSAGRVQSVALQMVAEREKEIRSFIPEEYWNFKADFKVKSGNIEALLEKVNGEKVSVANGDKADKIKKEIESAGSFSVTSVEKKEKKESPQPPLNTSNLQQEASRLYNYTAEQIMRLAQSLYEGKDLGDEGETGLITYMRTDSFRVSEEANNSLRNYISNNLGSKYLSPKTRFYANKKGKTQDAHEAIRPTNVALTPERVASKLTRDELNIYSLIWRRFVATQMSDAIYENTVVLIEDDKKKFLFKKTGSLLQFDGYRKIYKRNGRDDAILETTQNETADLNSIDAQQHFTKPTPRFTEGSLVKELEDQGVGRPSTYATVIKQIVQRNYIERMKEPKGALMATDLGVLVSDTLISFFPEIINIGFTADMESELDTVETGDKEWLDVVHSFYGTFDKVLNLSISKVKEEGKKKLIAVEPCPKCGKQLVVRWSKKGNQPFLSCESYPECNFAGSMEKKGEEIHLKPTEQLPQQELNEKCPKCGSPVVIKHGRYGEFKACSAYPKCKTIIREEKFISDCPREGCDGKITQKRSQRGKLFFGCTSYPKCDFVSWYPPVEGEKCEKCGFQYIVEKKRAGKVCQSCGHKAESGDK
ncbi:MAG: type I DNA topoisomerase [bacterium]